MNGTIIDIPNITASVLPIELNGSTDKAFIIYIKDSTREVSIEISYGQITKVNETIRSNKH